MAARRSVVSPFMIAAASASDSPGQGTSFLLGPAECLRAVPLQQIPRARVQRLFDGDGSRAGSRLGVCKRCSKLRTSVADFFCPASISA